MDGTSQPVDLLLSVTRDGPHTLGAQIEEQLRRAIREGTLRPGARVPSTRDLARQLGVSRRLTVEAYTQLAAEGYLSLSQGARPRVSDTAAAAPAAPVVKPPALPPRYDFRPSVPDVSTFPRSAWLRAYREALASLSDADLGYGDPCGDDVLRRALADYLGRVRGVVAEPARVVVTNGFTRGSGSPAKRSRSPARAGSRSRTRATRSRSRSPRGRASNRSRRLSTRRAPRRPPPPVDAVLVTPAHQHPTGAVLAPERRTALLAYLREHDAFAIEDDYDAEYRYDRAAVGALQGLEPDRVFYAGSTSKTLAPALRLGWLVVPARFLDTLRHDKLLADQGTARIEQHAFANFLKRGELDRHLRRMRATYRARRDALVNALEQELPEATVRGVAAGLHVTVELPEGYDEQAIKRARRSGGGSRSARRATTRPAARSR